MDKDAADTKAEPEPALPAEIRKEHPPTLPKPVLKTALIEEGWASLMLAFEEMFADLQGTLLEAFKPLMIADAPPMQVCCGEFCFDVGLRLPTAPKPTRAG